MGRIVKELKLGKKTVKALFDSGAERSYITKHALPKGLMCQKISPFEVGLGGKEHRIRESCILEPSIENLKFSFESHPINKLGKVYGEDIDILIGAPTMEKWDMILDLRKKKIDLRGLKKREFVDF